MYVCTYICINARMLPMTRTLVPWQTDVISLSAIVARTGILGQLAEMTSRRVSMWKAMNAKAMNARAA